VGVGRGKKSQWLYATDKGKGKAHVKGNTLNSPSERQKKVLIKVWGGERPREWAGEKEFDRDVRNRIFRKDNPFSKLVEKKPADRMRGLGRFSCMRDPAYGRGRRQNVPLNSEKKVAKRPRTRLKKIVIC